MTSPQGSAAAVSRETRVTITTRYVPSLTLLCRIPRRNLSVDTYMQYDEHRAWHTCCNAHEPHGLMNESWAITVLIRRAAVIKLIPCLHVSHDCETIISVDRILQL